MGERAIPLCLPDNYSWNQQRNRCIKQREHRSSYKLVDTALRRLEAVQGPICVVAVAGPLRKGKSFILSQPFAGNREIFPLGHDMNPETVGLWMWVVPEKYYDAGGTECTVVLIDSEGIDSTNVQKHDDDTILTLAVLISSVLIYNSSGVPNRSDLEELRFVMRLSQRIEVFTGKKTTSVQAKVVFPSFIWLLRDVVLSIPEDCRDLTEYFIKHVFTPTTYKPQDNAQQVTETILNFFPSFQAFSLPFPSFDPKIIKTMTHESSRSALNPKFPEEIERFSKELKSKLRLKTTPDGNNNVTGEALSSMVQSYVQTLNTPGSVPSISGAWEQYIGEEGHKIYQIANTVYFNEMKERLEGRLPCDSQYIRDLHNDVTEDVSTNVFEAAVQSKGISAQQLAKYTEEFQDESEDIESSWLLRNNELTESSCLNVFKEVKKEILNPVRDIWKTFENQGQAESRIRSAYDAVIKKFKARCRGCKEIIDSLATLHKEELDEAMHHDIEIVRQCGNKKDEKYARELERKEIEQLEESVKVVNIVLKDEIESISKKMRDLEFQYQDDITEMKEEAKERLLKERERFEAMLRQNEATERRQLAEIQESTQRLEARREELQQALEQSEKTLNDLKKR